ncbi:hypothetical protein HMPREF0083_02412 [Aneurinibacillus aneurinilyticus ATCC 12856]|uniref:Uncharacterized protein n=1 Tax=Aneurinibacillus aneurinilyticus ATCC 12856 TaxID=649747 RepID=U1YFI8_ANEAE|nr:hypothetical protein HMPREF0083_02412 [Aneurinibacillus aneurinilyticus ATCC 12856]
MGYKETNAQQSWPICHWFYLNVVGYKAFIFALVKNADWVSFI